MTQAGPGRDRAVMEMRRLPFTTQPLTHPPSTPILPPPCPQPVQGCMKSGQVLTDKRWKWYEPEHWRFGDPAGSDGRINYMRHASGACARAEL